MAGTLGAVDEHQDDCPYQSVGQVPPHHSPHHNITLRASWGVVEDDQGLRRATNDHPPAEGAANLHLLLLVALKLLLLVVVPLLGSEAKYEDSELEVRALMMQMATYCQGCQESILKWMTSQPLGLI